MVASHRSKLYCGCIYKYCCVHRPVLHDEGEEVGHGGGPQLAQGVVIKAGVQADDLGTAEGETLRYFHHDNLINIYSAISGQWTQRYTHLAEILPRGMGQMSF